jgi:hypothetical protein
MYREVAVSSGVVSAIHLLHEYCFVAFLNWSFIFQ